MTTHDSFKLYLLTLQTASVTLCLDLLITDGYYHHQLSLEPGAFEFSLARTLLSFETSFRIVGRRL